MYARAVYALGAAWAALFLASFIIWQATDPTGDGFARGLNRLASFMTWQGVAFGLAVVSAFVTSRGAGSRNFKLIGYGPLVASVLLLGMLVAIIAFRVLVQPAFG
jgi:hypothetical protein